MLRALSCAALLAAFAAQPQGDVPARYRGGSPPPVPVRAVSGGEVLLELPVTRDGVITDVHVLRSTPPFTDAMTAAVRAWRFAPAEQDAEAAPGVPAIPLRHERIDSTVLVAGMFAAPTLNTPTVGTPPRDIAAPASQDTPFPISTIVPRFPPNALMGGVVMLEVTVAREGTVADARVIVSAPAFDQLALDAARLWTFRPGRARGLPASKMAYIVFGFPQPVVGR